MLSISSRQVIILQLAPAMIYFISFSFSIILFSCNNYPSVKISNRPLNKSCIVSEDKKNNLNEIPYHYSLFTEEKKGYVPVKSRPDRIYYRRFLIYSSSHTVQAEINNKAVEYVIDGMFDRARYLFIESLKENRNFVPALNNLGVVYELLRQKKNAFEMYSSACLTDPEDDFVRWNFLFLCDNKPGSCYDEPVGIYFLQQ